MASLVASGVTNDNWSFWDVVGINRPSLLGVPDQATVDQPYQAFDRGQMLFGLNPQSQSTLSHFGPELNGSG
ncbi:hypothetical protein F2Q70_00001776 [Brassica cretica]|uniref:Uncharacterized protein n=1 Tax=Brassica cretica TaxID=69181 RepID=A0A8S9IWU2_BRACR|nr:hypothetical protein F2Q70_00001776 [Brassica cretica]